MDNILWGILESHHKQANTYLGAVVESSGQDGEAGGGKEGDGGGGGKTSSWTVQKMAGKRPMPEDGGEAENEIWRIAKQEK